ncbi:MAG TPA: rhomboid family intramembrane serine protease [Thermoanaerobaculia bacterium]|jgi:rhomboid protease GluP|nr:rhomboid family intramembrane serine protease [Thermoanaerobaculia bacterium]
MFGARTPVTSILLVAIAAVFVLETVRGGSTSTQVLLALGADYPPLVQQGEYWRLVTSLFLHIGFLHLALNGWALYQLGGLFELLLGSGRLLLVYFVSGIVGSIASNLFTHALSAGASGAIFGIMGAIIAFLAKRRENLTPQAKSLLMQLLLWAGINVFLGFTTPGIDNAAHLGGCAAGLAIGFFLKERPRYAPVPPVPGM